ncbi:hypothetical protein [Streptomyces pini]|uniref:hypothetical protein n=1 Tax=Streptomyces pini TaxID=1520580 RepID=UPI001114DFAC|nr:hypothetical protein [Streptomyces pini]
MLGTYERDRSPAAASPYGTYAAPYWVAQLPHRRDKVVAHAKDWLNGRMLARLAEAGGPAGYALHWQIAWKIGCPPIGYDRDAAVDALLLLAGQEQALIRNGSSSPKRVTDGLRAGGRDRRVRHGLVRTGGRPALAAARHTGPGSRGTHRARGRARCAAKGRIPEVEAVAARTGSSQTVEHARPL